MAYTVTAYIATAYAVMARIVMAYIAVADIVMADITMAYIVIMVQMVMAYIVMAYTVMAHVVMAYIVMACIVMAYVVTAYIVMACIVMACVVMAYIVIAYIVMIYIVTAYIVMAYICTIQGADVTLPFEADSLDISLCTRLHTLELSGFKHHSSYRGPIFRYDLPPSIKCLKMSVPNAEIEGFEMGLQCVHHLSIQSKKAGHGLLLDPTPLVERGFFFATSRSLPTANAEGPCRPEGT